MKIKLYNKHGKLLYEYKRIYDSIAIALTQIYGYSNGYSTTLLNFDKVSKTAWLSTILVGIHRINDLTLTIELYENYN